MSPSARPPAHSIFSNAREAERAHSPRAEWRGPVEAGDLLRLPMRRPLSICLIDGYFPYRPAVGHKEILLLFAQGVPIARKPGSSQDARLVLRLYSESENVRYGWKAGIVSRAL